MVNNKIISRTINNYQRKLLCYKHYSYCKHPKENLTKFNYIFYIMSLPNTSKLNK